MQPGAELRSTLEFVELAKRFEKDELNRVLDIRLPEQQTHVANQPAGKPPIKLLEGRHVSRPTAFEQALERRIEDRRDKDRFRL